MNQQHFETMVRGLAAQGWEQSMRTADYGPQCAYRGDEGRKCAAGHLLPDEKYSPDMESQTCSSALVSSALPADVLLNHLSTCQGMHDRNNNPVEMRQAFIDFASRVGFTFPEGL